jgi:hypothetical protein
MARFRDDNFKVLYASQVRDEYHHAMSRFTDGENSSRLYRDLELMNELTLAGLDAPMWVDVFRRPFCDAALSLYAAWVSSGMKTLSPNKIMATLAPRMTSSRQLIQSGYVTSRMLTKIGETLGIDDDDPVA